jgi:hypothetical protein
MIGMSKERELRAINPCDLTMHVFLGSVRSRPDTLYSRGRYLPRACQRNLLVAAIG